MLKKIKLSILLSLFLAPAVHAQITITQQHMPSAGDTIRYSTANTSVSFDFQSTGANYDWDFRNLQPNSQGLYEFKSSLQTPYILSFGFTAIGLKIADTLGAGQLQLKNVYNFFKKSSSAYEAVGLGFQYAALPLPQSGKHSDPDRIYKFPLTYGDKDTDTYAVTIPISLAGFPVGSLTQKGTRISETDGWGTISTPYGNNIACIRVVSQIDEYDSISIGTLNVNTAIQTQRTEYKWLSTSEKVPILEITGTWAGRTFIPTIIRYRDIPRNIGNPLQVVASFTADKTLADEGDTVRFLNTSSGLNLNYRWAFSPTTGYEFVDGTDANSKEPRVKFNNPGYYSVKLVASNQLLSDSMGRPNYIEIRARIPGSTGDQNTSALRIFPNPSSGNIQLAGFNFQEGSSYQLYDMLGKVHSEGEIPQNLTLFFPEAQGIYLLKITSGIHTFSELVIFSQNAN